MTLADQLVATPPHPPLTHRRQEHPTGREYEWDGSAGFIRTEPLNERPTTWDAFIEDAGLDPTEVEVVEPVQVRGWDSPVGGGSVVRMHYYRLTVRRRNLKVDLDELVKAAKRTVRQRAKVAGSQTGSDSATAAYVVALGDLQLGKMDGDGVEGTVQRFLDTTELALKRYRRIAKGAPVYLIHLGDCIEGMVSQGGANTWRTQLTTTEQVRLYRRILLEQVKAFAGVTESLTVVGIPGNHDEAYRPIHTYGDSWAIDAVSQVSDAANLAGGYDHVAFHTPARDELTLTLDVRGTVVGMAHGHQFGTAVNGWSSWWAKQSHGRQPVGDADLLLAAHKHHLHVQHTGSNKTFVQVPALESGSKWWVHKTGEWGQPGIVTLLVGGGTWSGLEVLAA